MSILQDDYKYDLSQVCAKCHSKVEPMESDTVDTPKIKVCRKCGNVQVYDLDKWNFMYVQKGDLPSPHWYFGPMYGHSD